MATWPATADELTQLQQALGELTPEHWQPPTTVLWIGACLVCFERVDGAGAAGDRGFAGAAVTHRRRLLAGVTSSGLMVPARYNFLYSSSRPALRAAACGGRPRAGSRLPGAFAPELGNRF